MEPEQIAKFFIERSTVAWACRFLACLPSPTWRSSASSSSGMRTFTTPQCQGWQESWGCLARQYPCVDDEHTDIFESRHGKWHLRQTWCRPIAVLPHGQNGERFAGAGYWSTGGDAQLCSAFLHAPTRDSIIRWAALQGNTQSSYTRRALRRREPARRVGVRPLVFGGVELHLLTRWDLLLLLHFWISLQNHVQCSSSPHRLINKTSWGVCGGTYVSNLLLKVLYYYEQRQLNKWIHK